MPTDLKLDPDTHDIDLSSGTAVLFQDNLEVVGQRVKIAVLTGRGEWFRAVNEGVPYYQEIFTSKNSKAFTDNFMISYISKVEDVSRIISYNSTINIDSRVLDISVVVETYDGNIVEINIGGA